MSQKNKYHKYINLPFELKKPQICNVMPKNLKHYDIPHHEDLQLNEFLKQFDLLVTNTELFYTPGGQKLPIHIDDWREDDHVKINISWGPPEGTTRWWNAPNFTGDQDYDSTYKSHDDLDDSIKAYNFSDRHHHSIIHKEEDCELVYEANTNKSSLVNVGTFHSSYNPTKEGRWTLCFVLGHKDYDIGSVDGFKGRIKFSKALKIFKKFIDDEDF